MTRRGALFGLALMLSIATTGAAYAACSNPSGAAGDIVYSATSATMYYCNNTNWVVMGSNVPTGLGSLTTGAFCTAASGSQINCTTGSIGLASQVTGTLLVANGGTGATSLTQGSVVFGGSSTYAQDNSNFFWDATNHRLGIGTASPANLLDVNGTGSIAAMSINGTTNSTGVSIQSRSGYGLVQGLASGSPGTLILNAFGGNVGIGTTSPTSALDVSGNVTIAAQSGFEINTYYSSGWKYRANGYGNVLYQDGSGDFIFSTFGNNSGGAGTAATEGQRMVILNGGNVGIGTTGPTALLHVAGVARVNELIIGETGNSFNGSIEITYNDLANYGIYFNDTNSGAMNAPAAVFNKNGSAVGSISLTNTNTSFNTSSDRRLKENIVPTSRGLNAVLKIEADDFNFIADSDKTRVQGFIAQDLYKVYPEAVTIGGDDPKTKPWSIDYGRVTPLIIKAVQELKSLIDTDHDAIAKLGADNDNLRTLIQTQGREIEALKKAAR